MTLKQFVAKCGTQEKAAQKIGVSWATVNRWLHGQRKPTGLSVERLKALGVKA